MEICQNFQNYFDYLSECLEMYQEDLTTIMAPISDDEIFIIEDFVGSGDVIIDDIVTTEETVNTTASQPSTFETVVNSTRITTVDTTEAAKTVNTTSQQITVETMVNSTGITTVDTTEAAKTVNTTSQQITVETMVNSTGITTVDTTAALTSEATSTMPLTSSNPTMTLDMILPLIGCTTSGWVGVALFAYYLCKGRRRYTPANAEYSSARLSPGETLV